ncbi:alpha/beta fold hydrolase [Anaerostipes faecalis]|uniref:alpha/beta fold hydrolase n=1 Tax=Anaerostipes faecalis TaxID=2738446 RepID=UPI001C1DE3A5|nr:alpha/beta fold hydrolase [Anaerostipes faecalis]
MEKSFYLMSDVDQLELHVLLMEPEGAPKGIIQICHGMAEHKERYIAFMETLCEQGYVTVIHDHRGHGKSIRSDGDLGYFYDDTGEAIVDDAHQLTMWMKKKYPGIPYHLFGHSMGSLVVRCYLKKYDKELDSLVVCGSPSENPMAGFAVGLAKIMCRFGDKKPGNLFHKIAFFTYGKILEKDESPNGWISYNKENVKKYDENPLDGFMFTNNGFLNLFLLMKNTYSKKGWDLRHPSLPILFIAGAEDPCIGSKKQFTQAINFLKHQGYNHVQGTLFLNRRHEILNEDDVEKVYNVILSFFSAAENSSLQ